MSTYPLSFVQERLRLLERLRPDEPQRLHKRLRLHAALDEDALRRAIGLVHERHALLRTAFDDGAGGTRQRPLPLAEHPPVVEVGTGGASPARLRGEQAAPDVRWRLDGTALDVELRALTCDGVSLRLLLGDLAVALRDPAAAAAASPPGRAYHEFAARERESWTPEREERFAGAWRRLLAGVEPTGLPYDALAGGSPRATVEARAGLPAAVATGLRREASASRTTIAAACLAGWRASLRRWSGAAEPLTFVAVSRRTHRSLSATVGPFTDFLPLPGPRAPAAPPVEDAADRLLTLLEHGEAPLQSVVRWLPPGLGGPRGPFTALFTYVPPAPAPAVPPPWEEEHGADTGEDFDLHLAVIDGGERVELRLRSAAGALRPESVRTLLAEVVEDLARVAERRPPAPAAHRAGRPVDPGAPGTQAAAGAGTGAPGAPPAAGAVADAWRSVLGSPPAHPDQDLRAAGGHSLLLPELADALRDRLGVPVPLELLCRAHVSVRTLAAALADGDADGAGATEPSPRARLAEVLPRVPRGSFPEPPGVARRWLLTGATGFLGAHLLAELLADPQNRVRCLVRAPGDDGRERLARHAERLRLGDALDWRRVDVVAGDLATPALGLTAAQEAEIAASTDAILHAGAWVNFLYPYAALAPANVEGTLGIIQVAARCERCVLHHVSTTGVLEAASDPDAPAGGYAATKWVAEEAVLEARRRGLAARAHRPAWIVGHGSSGACQPSDYLWAVLATCAELGTAPDEDFAVPCLTVEDAARAIVAAPAGGPPVAALPAIPGVTWRRLVAGLDAAGHPLHLVPTAEWLAEAERRAPRRIAPFAGLMRASVARDGRWNPVAPATLGAAPPAAGATNDVERIVARCADFLALRAAPVG